MDGAGRSWVDLVDVRGDDRVLLVDAGSRRAEAALRLRSGHVSVVGGPGIDERVLRAIQDGPWDLVCLDAIDVEQVPAGLWSTALSEGGRVVVVGDTLLSPVRVMDMVLRHTSGPGARLGPGATVDRLREVGLFEQQMFGLLRSSTEPVVAFDALALSSLPAVWDATLAHVRGRRRSAMNAVARLSARQVLRLCPGWLVVAGTTPDGAPDRVVGKVSNRDSSEVKLLRGEPISSVERHYLLAAPGEESAALRELEEAGFGLAPRVLHARDASSSRFTYLRGTPLRLDDLDEQGLVRWVGRVAQVLAELQQLTRRDDGTVLVHGDLWLGNVLVEGDRVTAVLDWTQAHRGSAATDRDFLVASLERWITSEELRRSLVRARDEVFASS